MKNNSVGPLRKASALSGGNTAKHFNQLIQSSDSSIAKQVGKMILVIMVPVVALIVKTSISFAEALTTQRTATVLGEVIEHALDASEGIHLIQKERGLTAVHMGSHKGASNKTYLELANIRLISNEFLAHYTVSQPILLPAAPKPINTGLDIIEHLDTIRASVDLQDDNVTMLDIIERYSKVNLALIRESLRVSLVPSRQDIWPLVVSFGALFRAIDAAGMQRGIGGAAFSACGLTTKERNAFLMLNSMHSTLLTSSFQFYPAVKSLYEANYTFDGDLHKVLTQQKVYILNNSAMADLCREGGQLVDQQGQLWFEAASQYMQVLTGLQNNVTELIRNRIPGVQKEATFNIAVYMSIMIVVSVTCILLSVWYSIQLSKMNSNVRAAITNVRAKSEAVKDEKKKTDILLYQMMPRRVADNLKSGKEVTPEWFDNVTIYFSDIQDWHGICTRSTPEQIVALLNDLYNEFDDIIMKYEVYKVETIADSYMCVSGLPEKNPKHATAIALLALEMIAFAKTFTIQHLPDTPLGLRIGFNSGPCVAGVVGTISPRYCLFGDTVNIASRMGTNSAAFYIHISKSSKRLLDQTDNFETRFRGNIPIKGKGLMTTYWLIKRKESPIKQVKIDGGPDAA